MSDMGGLRPRASMLVAAGDDDPPPSLERKGVAAGQRAATPIAARLNGRPVQVQVQVHIQAQEQDQERARHPPALMTSGPQDPAGRASACRRITQSAVQVLGSWSPWAQPEPLAGGADTHYLALARRQVGRPPTDAQLQGFVKAVMAREAGHGFFRPPLAEMRAAYAALAEVLDLASADAGLLGRVIDALHAADASPQHRLGAAESLARALGAPRLSPGPLGHLLRVLGPGASADPAWRAMLLGMLCAVMGGSGILPVHLQALVQAAFPPRRAGAGDDRVRRAQFQALVHGIGERIQVQVPGYLWGQRSVAKVQALTQAQVTQVARSLLATWRPDALAVEQVMGDWVLVLDTCLPDASRVQAHRWIAQALVQHGLDPRSPVAGVPCLPGMGGSPQARQVQDVTAAGGLGLAAALLVGLPNDDDVQRALLATEIVEPTLRASPRLPATRLRPMARYPFAAVLASMGTRGLAGALMARNLPVRVLLTSVLARIGGLSLQQAGAWVGGAFSALGVLNDPRKIRRDDAARLGVVFELYLMELSIEQVLAASANEPRLSRLALVGYEAGCALVQAHALEVAVARVVAFIRSLGMAAFFSLPEDRRVALLAGLAMALGQRITDPRQLEGLMIEHLPKPPSVAGPGPGGTDAKRARRPPLPRQERMAQRQQVHDALAIARHPGQVLGDPRFAAGDDALEMLLLACAMPLASGADDLNQAVDALARLPVPTGVLREALARVANQRGAELTPGNFGRVHRAMLEQLREASPPPAARAKADGKREVRGLDEDEPEVLHFEAAQRLLQFYEELRESSGLMFVFSAGGIDLARLRASEPAIRHLMALLASAQADVRDLLKAGDLAPTRQLLDGTLEKIRLPLQQALQVLQAPSRHEKALPGASIQTGSIQ